MRRILGLTVVVLAGAWGVNAQQTSSQQREVNIAALALYNPVQFIGLTDQGTTYAAPKSAVKVITFLDGSSDWIGNVSITIENHSTKHIVAIEFMVSVIPAWDQDVFHTSHAILFHEGQLPEHTLHLADGTPIPEESSMVLYIAPRGTANIPLNQAYLKLTKVLDRAPSLIPLASVDSIRVQLYRIFFSNGTNWSWGAYRKPDVSSISAYVPITREEWESIPDK